MSRLSKSEARLLRKEAASQKKQVKSAVLVSRSKSPRLEQSTAEKLEPNAETKTPRYGNQMPNVQKHEAKEEFSQDRSYLSRNLTWSYDNSDREGSWSWGLQRQWTDNDFHSKIGTILDSLRGNTWKEIVEMICRDGQRPRARHHVQKINSVMVEVQDRWGFLNIETDEAFRFRSTGRWRLWGYRTGSHFFLIWHDPDHTFYKVDKRNT